MPPSPEPPRQVLARYGAAVAGVRWVPLGSAGGLSGALLWRGDAGGRPALALKGWPPDITAARLAEVHALLRRAGRLPFVPAVVPAADGATAVESSGRVWDLCRWMPGAADFHADPTPGRLANAAAALTAVHRELAPAAPRAGPCPAVRRRLGVLADVRREPLPFSRPPRHGHSDLDDAVGRAAAAVARLTPWAEAALAPWAARPVPVRPCLVDVRRDHVLFSGDAVTGLVDWGAAADDHPAADLARLLGDLAGEDDARFAAGLAAYAAAGGPPEPAPGFARLLDHTGVVCAAGRWVLRLAAGPPADPAVAPRVAALAARVERFGPG